MTRRHATRRWTAFQDIGHRRVPQWLAAGLLVVMLPGAVLAKSKQPSTWEKSTHIESADDASNPVCAPVIANISHRVATIKALKAALQKAEAGPPTSVKSALQGLFGRSEPTTNMIAIERKIVSERGAADKLNTMLQSLQCAPVDIDAALAAESVPATGGLPSPDASLDDLVQAPR